MSFQVQCFRRGGGGIYDVCIIKVVAIKKIFCKSFFIAQLSQELLMVLQYLQGFDLIKFLSVHTVYMTHGIFIFYFICYL